MAWWQLGTLIMAVVLVAATGAIVTRRLPAGRRWIGAVITFAIVVALPFLGLAILMLTARSCGADGVCG